MIQQVIDGTRAVISVTRTLFISQEDLSGPIHAARTICTADESIWNKALLHLRYSLRQRTQFRVSFDVLTRHRGKSTYKRLKKDCVRINVGSPEQAELAIEAILTFAQSLDGKWLAPAETSVTPDSSSVKVSQVNEHLKNAEDSPAICGQSATDSLVSSDQGQEQEPRGLGNEQVSEDSGNPRAGK